MQTPVDWRASALRMRARGKAACQIAAELGKSVDAVREALRGTRRTRLAVLGAGRAEIPEPHVARVPRVVLDRQALPFAAAEFAAGLIDRAEPCGGSRAKKPTKAGLSAVPDTWRTPVLIIL